MQFLVVISYVFRIVMDNLKHLKHFCNLQSFFLECFNLLLIFNICTCLLEEENFFRTEVAESTVWSFSSVHFKSGVL